MITSIGLTLELEFLLRVILSGICGILIGYERKSRGKGAGVRTHMIVALASSLMMIISKYGFTDIASLPGMRSGGADGSRIASQIVSGIGFLGAGMIYVHKNSITGLTTAAGIWATAGIGMAVGAGMYVIGISTTFIVILSQIILHKNLKFLHIPSEISLVAIIECDDEAISTITKEFDKRDLVIEKLMTSKEGEYIKLDIVLVTQASFNPAMLVEFTEQYDFIKSISY